MTIIYTFTPTISDLYCSCELTRMNKAHGVVMDFETNHYIYTKKTKKLKPFNKNQALVGLLEKGDKGP